MEVEYIRYKHGMLDKPSQRKRLKAYHLDGNHISQELKSLIEENDILSISGTIGRQDGGAPIEYEEVKIRSRGRETTFEVYNKGMSIFFQETAELKRVFPLCCKLYEQCRL